MQQDKIKIAIKKLNALVVTKTAGGKEQSKRYCLSLNVELMALGFSMSQELFEHLSTCSEKSLLKLQQKLLPAIKEMLGDNVKHQPMYPNFPKQVIDMANMELYFNAICHYWTAGAWLPSYYKLPRKYAFEAKKFREIGIADENQFKDIFTQLLSSKDSLSQEDKDIIAWFMASYDLHDLGIPEEIPFAETRCVLAGELIKSTLPFENYVQTTTDILRIATYLSGGDVSLAENTKFKSLPRKTRKALVKALEGVIKEEDIHRHKNKWVRLFHNLHVGEFSPKVAYVAKKVRNNMHIATFNSKVENFLERGKLYPLVDLLMKRAGEFARRLDHILRSTQEEYEQLLVVEKFLSVVDQVPSKNLLQLLGHLNRRVSQVNKRVVYPKGNAQKAVVVRSALEALPVSIVGELQVGINQVLIERFAQKPRLGKVWVDPDLIDCPLPSQQRSASEGLFNVARGTKLPIGDKSTLRFFVYWEGRDIDLSATFHDERFNMIEQVSYTNLKSTAYKAYHSGDITDAPNGASEFIDIDISSALKYGASYVVMNVMVYCGPTFKEHKSCFAGWMTRNKPNSNEIYDPKTVDQKIDIATASRNVIPVIFDLKTRKAIWADITMNNRDYYGGNNVHSNSATINEKLEAIVSSEHLMSLYELFYLHAAGRGEIVNSKEEAETTFSVYEGIGPYDINLINSEYIA